MAKIIGVVSTKGGVGKSTMAGSLGAILADMGQKVLLVDSDPQATLSDFYPVNKPADRGFTELVREYNPDGCISQTSINNLYVVQNNDYEQQLIFWLREATRHIYYLKAALDRIRDVYDIIIIDTPGDAGILLEPAILASDILLSPIVPEKLSSQEFFRGTLGILERLQPPPGVALPVAPVPPLAGVIYRQNRTAESTDIANKVRKKFYDLSGGRISILKTFVPELTVYRTAANNRVPVHRLETRRDGPTPPAIEVLTSLVHEILPHLSDIQPVFDGKKEVRTNG